METGRNTEDIIREKWDEIKETVRRDCDMTSVSYTTWINPLIFGSYADGVAHVIIPHDNEMALEYIRKRFVSFFVVAICDAAGLDDIAVEFSLQGDEPESKGKEPVADADITQMLKPKYTFENFVVGDGNRFAYSAAVAVAENPGTIYNPLFLYGGAGLGKTHLLQAIGNYIHKNTPGLKVLYVTSEDFTNEVVNYVGSGQREELHEKYRTVDVLMIDDVQFIVGKTGTQLEFFHTFNALYQDNKQIVLSADRHPREIKEIDERYRSRFEMGLTSDIQMPDYETRMAILRKLNEGKLIDIKDEVLDYIANGGLSNVRELEGAYTKICAYARLKKLRVLDIEDAKLALKDDIGAGRSRNITPAVIIGAVAEQYSISVELLRSKKRSDDVVTPRQLAMYLSRVYTDATLESIGKELGNRDHSTVKNGIKRIEDMLVTDEELNRNIEVICVKLNLRKNDLAL